MQALAFDTSTIESYRNISTAQQCQAKYARLERREGNQVMGRLVCPCVNHALRTISLHLSVMTRLQYFLLTCAESSQSAFGMACASCSQVSKSHSPLQKAVRGTVQSSVVAGLWPMYTVHTIDKFVACSTLIQPTRSRKRKYPIARPTKWV